METPTQFYRKYMQNPQNATFSFLLETRKELLSLIEERDKEATKRIVQMVIEQMKGEKGDKPVKGEDYLTPEEINTLVEEIRKKVIPVKGEDYFTPREIRDLVDIIYSKIEIPAPIPGKPGKDAEPVQLPDIKKMIEKEVGMFMEMPHKEMSKEEIVKIAQSVQKTFDAKEFAEPLVRAMEDLPTQKKLDYDTGLKNKPGIPTYKEKSKIARMGRGTGATSGGVLSFETPVGNVDDTNTSFTVSNQPLYILVNGIAYTVGVGLYSSYVAGTITLSGPVGTGGFILSFYS